MPGQRQPQFIVERPTGDALLQGGPAQVLHYNEGATLLLADVVNGADVRVVQGGGRLRLSLKTGQSRVVTSHLIRYELERHEPVKARILGLVYHPHAAAKLLNMR